MAWYDGQATSPDAGDVVADTGPMTAGNYTFAAAAYASMACTFELQAVASNGTTVLKRQRVFVASGQSSLTLPGITATLQTDERLRIVVVSALPVGTVGASIFAA